MAVYVPEVGDPVRWRGLVWFGDEGNSLGGQGTMGSPHHLYLKNNFCRTGDMR